MKKIIILTISLLFGVIIGSSIQKNYTPEKVVIEKDTVYINDTVFVEEIIPLSEKGVLVELIKQEVPHPYIVLAQSKLETGNYKSKLCKTHNNIFGMRTSKGYKRYNNYVECIEDYKRLISSRYKGGDYYAYLKRIGYAEDSSYIDKLKKL